MVPPYQCSSVLGSKGSWQHQQLRWCKSRKLLRAERGTCCQNSPDAAAVLCRTVPRMLLPSGRRQGALPGWPAAGRSPSCCLLPKREGAGRCRVW